jgi:SAM-dependent methyltransferase
MSAGLSAARQTAGLTTAGQLTLARQEAPEDDRDPVSAKLLQLVGAGKRVLALGRAHGDLLRGLKQQGCEVVSVQPDSTQEPVEGDFDAIVAVNALEYLRDPLRLLEGLKVRFRPECYLVAAVPNVAHGNVRLALLGGRFPLAEPGRLDGAPVRFFTYDSLASLFESAGYALGAIERLEEDVAVPEDGAPAEVVESVLRAPEARTAQFVAVAYPVPASGGSWLQGRLRELAEQHAAARRELEEVREDLQAADSHLRILVEQQQASLTREKELRARAEEAHDALARRDEEVRGLREAAMNGEQLQAKLQEAAAQVLRQEEEIRELRGKLSESGEKRKWREERYTELLAQRDALEARLNRFRNSLPGRFLRAVRKLFGR